MKDNLWIPELIDSNEQSKLEQRSQHRLKIEGFDIWLVNYQYFLGPLVHLAYLKMFQLLTHVHSAYFIIRVIYLLLLAEHILKEL